MSNLDIIKAALRANIDNVIDHLADDIAILGSKEEWSLEDNFCTTEGIAGMAGAYGLPSANSQPADALKFYRAAALELGFGPDELGYDAEDDDTDN